MFPRPGTPSFGIHHPMTYRFMRHPPGVPPPGMMNPGPRPSFPLSLFPRPPPGESFIGNKTKH